jgi:hypothetical protein
LSVSMRVLVIVRAALLTITTGSTGNKKGVTSFKGMLARLI